MTEAKIYVPTTDAKTPARTYNQIHQPRKFTGGTTAGQHLRVLELSRVKPTAT